MMLRMAIELRRKLPPVKSLCERLRRRTDVLSRRGQTFFMCSIYAYCMRDSLSATSFSCINVSITGLLRILFKMTPVIRAVDISRLFNDT